MELSVFIHFEINGIVYDEMHYFKYERDFEFNLEF